jgi:hypothetical protein
LSRLSSASIRPAVLVAVAVVALATFLLWISSPGRDRPRGRLFAAYARSLVFLGASQQADGGFPTYVWYTNDPGKTMPVTTVFTASQVLYSLAQGQPGPTKGLRERTIAYLLQQREPPGVWRYYVRDGARISPDVDDTAMAWAALKLNGHHVPPEALAALRASRSDSGLFNTWIGDPASWVGIDSRDVDLVVNLNALLLFALADQRVDEVCREAVADARAGTFGRRSVYYPSPLAFTHAFTRAYGDGGAACLGAALPEVLAFVLDAQRPDGGWGDDLETALGVLTLLDGGYRGRALDRGIRVIITRQAADGGWALAPAYRGATLPVRYGSRSLTTALCLEALAKYLER